METVSVIIPVYNTAGYIEQCIDSVLHQTYKSIEIIIIDDNSRDGSVEVIESYVNKEDNIKAYYFDERTGVGAARNFAIGKATGDYIYFLDSDDFLPPETIALLMSNIKDNNIICGKVKLTNLSSSFTLIFNGLFKPKILMEKRYNLIEKNSIANILFKRSFVDKCNLTFSEEVEVFSDLQFLIPAFMNVDHIQWLKEAIYFKRRRNDPINDPALSQYDEEYKVKDFLKVYSQLKSEYNDELVQSFLDVFLLNYYRKNIITYFTKRENIPKIFKPLSKGLKRIQPSVIKEYDWVLRREVNALMSNNIKRYRKVYSTHYFLRDLKWGLQGKRKLMIFLYNWLFLKLPMKKDLIFFESFLGKNYSDNPKYIYEYLLKENYRFKFVWSINERSEIPGNAIQVKRFSIKYFYYLARAKYWVNNSRLPKYLQKRKGNIYLQTWHGTPLKKLVFDMNDIYSADPKYKSNFYNQSRRWDYLNSPNEYSSEIFRRAFIYEKKLLEYGYPRNDILYEKNKKEDILILKKYLSIPEGKKVILYAPTWRDDDYFSRGKYNFKLELDLQMMQQELGHEYIVLLRLHYFIANQIDLSMYEGFAYDFSKYDDIAELYLVSDILITDYSSVFFDYANLKRPILFYTYDLEKYRKKLRGFYLDIEKDVPGPLLMKTKEVVNSINNIEKVKVDYKNRYNQFYERFCKWDNGQASQKTVEAVFEKK